MAYTPIRDLLIGRLGLPSVEAPIGELLGSEISTVGDATAVGQRRVKGFTMSFPVHGTTGDADPYLSGMRMRRQLRSLMQNHNYRLGGVYLKFNFDPERNGWMVIGTTSLNDADPGGVTVAEFVLTIDNAYRVAALNTHREGRRVDLTDLRLTTSPIDFLGQVINTGAGFAGLTALALTPVPVGSTDIAVLENPVTTGARSGIDGSCPICAGRSNGDVISWERPEASFNAGDVIVYDRRGNLGPFYRATVLADTPVSYWRADETAGTTATDLQGVQNGTYTGTVTLNQAGALTGAGDTDASVLLDGSTGYVRIPANAALETAKFSVECWVKPTSLPASTIAIFENRNGTTSGCFIYVNSSNQIQAAIYSSGSTTTPLASNALTVGVWSHIVLTYDGTTARLYVNGVQVSSVVAAFTVPTAVGAFGTDLGSGADFFPGNVDEMAYYNYALTATQVQNHYGQGVTNTGGVTAPTSSTYGWEEVYGPDYPWANPTSDVPVIQNSHVRVRYTGTANFALDVWTGSAWVQQGQMSFQHRGSPNEYLNTLIYATMREYTPERAVLEVVCGVSTDALARDQIYITLQRGWTGPRFEVYPSPQSGGGASDSSIEYTTTLARLTNLSAMKIDSGNAGVDYATATAGSSASWAASNVGAASFTGENEAVMLAQGASYQVNMAVLQPAAFVFVNTTDMGVYGGGGLGYLSAHFGFAPQQADQIMEAESMTLATGTTSVADASASGGNAAQSASGTANNPMVTRATWPNNARGKYRVFARIRPVATTTDTINIYAQTTTTTGATKTATGASYAWVDLGDIVADGSTLTIAAWNATAARTFNLDRIEAFLVEDRTATSPGYNGARDLAQSILYDSRTELRRLARA